MSVNIFHKTGSGTGTLQKVAGNTVILDANVSEVRQATVNIPQIQATNSTLVSVTFSTPMPDTDYVVTLDSGATEVYYESKNKSTTGFDITALNIRDTVISAHTVHYYAFKPIPMDGYTELQNKVNNPDSAPTSQSQNLVTSGGVFEALKNAGTVYTGTMAQWEALDPSEQDGYELVCITDDEEGAGGESYTTNEVNTGKTWIDGKPIYRKVYNVDITTYNDQSSRRSFTYSMNENIETLIDSGGVWIVKAIPDRPEIVGWTQTFGAAQMSIDGGLEYASSANSQAIAVRMLPTLWSAGGVTQITVKVWLEYTKTV